MTKAAGGGEAGEGARRRTTDARPTDRREALPFFFLFFSRPLPSPLKPPELR
jgi:hypothetical protein